MFNKSKTAQPISSGLTSFTLFTDSWFEKDGFISEKSGEINFTCDFLFHIGPEHSAKRFE